MLENKYKRRQASVQSKFLEGERVVDGEGASSEGCLKWGSGGH